MTTLSDVQAANARERRRMDRMNAAYVALRAALPGHREHILLSKRQTVQQVAALTGNMGVIGVMFQALQYITDLEKLLNSVIKTTEYFHKV